MSIPLVQEATKDAINTSIIAIKRNIERINMLLGLSNSEEIDTSKFVTKDELQQAVTDLQPVDEVAVDNMHSVSSNAVANALLNKANGHASVDVIYLTPRKLCTPSEMTSIFASKSDGIYLIKVGWEEYDSFWGAGANGYAIVTTDNSACVFGKLRDYGSPNYTKWFGWTDRVTIGSYQGLNSY